MSESRSGLILPYEGKMPKIADDVFVAPNATIIGDVEIGNEASIWFNVVIRGDVNEIRIGERTNIQDGTIVHVAGGNVTAQKFGTYIGSDVLIGHAAIIHACTLHDACFIGMGSTILDGAVVETDSMVAAGALVTPGKVVKSGELWAGAPAKPIRELREDDHLALREGVADYCRVAKQFLKEVGR